MNKQEVIICENIIHLKIYDNKENLKGTSLIDVKHLQLINGNSFSIDNKGYIRMSVKGIPILLHRVIANTPKGMVTDHINHNVLDNREVNLRICTKNQNLLNKKPYKNSKSECPGVYQIKSTGNWKSTIRINNKRISLGTFKNLIDAVSARKQAEEKYHGEFGYINSLKLANA